MVKKENGQCSAGAPRLINRLGAVRYLQVYKQHVKWFALFSD